MSAVQEGTALCPLEQHPAYAAAVARLAALNERAAVIKAELTAAEARQPQRVSAAAELDSLLGGALPVPTAEAARARVASLHAGLQQAERLRPSLDAAVQRAERQAFAEALAQVRPELQAISGRHVAAWLAMAAAAREEDAVLDRLYRAGHGLCPPIATEALPRDRAALLETAVTLAAGRLPASWPMAD
jgi:hypothetical protein